MLPGVVGIFCADVVDDRGLLVEQLLVPVGADLEKASGCPVTARLDRSQRAGVLRSIGSALEPSASEAAGKQVACLEAALRPRLEAERTRERALAEVAEAAPMAGVQPGLFDNRALRSADADLEQRVLLGEETRRRLETIHRASGLRLAAPLRLVLLALVRGR
jgi:hypothetical protein